MATEKARRIFGRLVVEKRRTRLSDLKEFPRYVIEYLIDQFCPGEDFDTEIAQVRRKLFKNYASPRMHRASCMSSSSVGRWI